MYLSRSQSNSPVAESSVVSADAAGLREPARPTLHLHTGTAPLTDRIATRFARSGRASGVSSKGRASRTPVGGGTAAASYVSDARVDVDRGWY
jgi:hypothetical protein